MGRILQISTQEPGAGGECLTVPRHQKGSRREIFSADWKMGRVTLLDHLGVKGAFVLWKCKFGILKYFYIWKGQSLSQLKKFLDKESVVRHVSLFTLAAGELWTNCSN